MRATRQFLLLLPWLIVIGDRIIGVPSFFGPTSSTFDIDSYLVPQLPVDPDSLCPDHLLLTTDTHLPTSITHPPGRHIPKLVHQTSKSRCLAPVYQHATEKWRFKDYSYYFYDDAAVDRFLRRKWPEFPQLQMVLQCLQCPTIKSDIWRYLVLWKYGGIYSDIDSIPRSTFMDFMQDNDEAFFVIEHYRILSQYFMAAAPKHPVMFHAVHIALNNVIDSKLGTLDASLVSGPHALHQAFHLFCQDVGQQATIYNVSSGTYSGTDGRTLRAVEIEGRPDAIVFRNSIPFSEKIDGYQQMNMTYYQHRQKAALVANHTNGAVYNATCLSLLYSSRTI